MSAALLRVDDLHITLQGVPRSVLAEYAEAHM